MAIKDVVEQIEWASNEYRNLADEKWLNIAIPLGSMGALEKAVTKICAAQRTLEPDLSKKCVIVFCADNGIVEEGVSQSGHDITGAVALNMCHNKTSVCKMGEIAKAKIIPVDIGMVNDVTDEAMVQMKIARGTNNFAKTSAMTREQAAEALEKGIKIASEVIKKGYNVLAVGEMGIGNTTTSSAVASILLEKEVQAMTGQGAGLSKAGIENKIRVIENAIKKHKPNKDDVLDVLSKVGGFDILGMTGVILGCASAKKICIIDGFISSVAALCAVKLSPKAKDYILASHVSAEPAAKLILEYLNLEPVIMAQMRVGEGTGAVAVMPLLDMSVKIFNEMVTFQETNIEAYKPL